MENGIENGNEGTEGKTIESVQENDPFPIENKSLIKYWNDDLICFLDFSDPQKIGYDCTGNNNYGEVKGVINYNKDYDGRPHSINIDSTNMSANANGNENFNRLTFYDNLEKFKVPSYTISIWFNRKSNGGFDGIFGIGKKTPTRNDINVTVTNQNKISFYGWESGLVLITSPEPVTIGWHHVVLTMDNTGHKFYYDGNLVEINYNNSKPKRGKNFEVQVFYKSDDGEEYLLLDGISK